MNERVDHRWTVGPYTFEVPSAYTEHYPEYLINEVVEDPHG